MVGRVMTGMKRLNVTLAILSIATCDIDATKTSVNNEVPSTRLFGKQCWWKDERRAPRDIICFEIDEGGGGGDGDDGGDDDDDDDDDDNYFLREAIKSLKLTPFYTVTSRYEDTSDRQSRYDASNSAHSKHETSYKANPTILASFEKRKLLGKKDHFASWCNSEKRYHRRQQGWKVQPPFYVEEPSWIEIGNNYAERIMENHSYRDRLETIDPFVITRGKKNHPNFILDDTGKMANSMTKYKRSMHSDSRHERDKNDDKIDKNVTGDNNKRDNENNEDDRVEKSWKKGSVECIDEPLFATGEKRTYDGKNNYLTRKYFETDLNSDRLGTSTSAYVNNRKDKETVSSVSMKTPRKVGAESVWNLAKRDLGLSNNPPFVKDNERRNKRFAIPNNLIVREPYYVSRGKKTDHRMNEEEILLGQRKPEESVSMTNSFIVGEILAKMRENNSKCDVQKCNDHFSETMKRTRLDRNLGDGMQGIFKDLLTRPDPFYVARGKRVN